MRIFLFLTSSLYYLRQMCSHIAIYTLYKYCIMADILSWNLKYNIFVIFLTPALIFPNNMILLNNILQKNLSLALTSKQQQFNMLLVKPSFKDIGMCKDLDNSNEVFIKFYQNHYQNQFHRINVYEIQLLGMFVSEYSSSRSRTRAWQ